MRAITPPCDAIGRTHLGVRLSASRRRRIAIGLACGYPGALLALCLLQSAMPRRSGPLGLSLVFAPYLFLPLLALSPLLFLRGAAPLRLLFLFCWLLFGIRFPLQLPRPAAPADPAATTISVMTWNVNFGGASNLTDVRRFVETRPADVIALQEDYLVWGDPDHRVWMARERALARVYPHQVRLNRAGLVILSVYPILEATRDDPQPSGSAPPPVAWGRLDLGGGRTVVVATAHPVNAAPARCRAEGWRCFDAAERDLQIQRVRDSLSPFLQRGEPLILVGDFNLTEQEPAYRDLVDGLRDAHREAGAGLGHTWVPPWLARRGLPLLRIDYMFSSPQVTPLRLAPDCARRGSDHCALHGRFAVP